LCKLLRGGHYQFMKNIMGAKFFSATGRGGPLKNVQIKIKMHQPSSPVINDRSLNVCVYTNPKFCLFMESTQIRCGSVVHTQFIKHSNIIVHPTR
jgi:hypothetical protein